jgi:iron complex outermembrane recepter protein
MMKLHLLAGTAIWLLPAFAQAQEAEHAPSWTNETVVVTGIRANYAEANATSATRTPTPGQNIPQSIESVNSTMIREQDLQTLSAALVNVSGVTPTSTMQTVLQPTLVRGFTVDYYFDGIPTYQLPPSVADAGTLVNVERIDVIKGPASTLYGGGTGAPLAGLINLISRDPTDSFHASAALRAGSFSTIGGEGDINIPLADGVAFRATGEIESAGSHIDFLHSQRYAIFPTLSWDISPDTKLVLRGRFNRLQQTEYAGIPETLVKPGLQINPYVFAGASDAPQTTVINSQISAFLTHHFSERLQADAAVSYFNGGFREVSAFPYGQIAGTVFNFGTAYLPSDTSKYFATASLLARLGDRAFSQQILVGADFDHTGYFGEMDFNPAWATIDYNAANPRLPFGSAPPFYFDEFDKMTSVAFFAQDQVGIGEKLNLTLGLRWTDLIVDSAVGGVPTQDRNQRFTPHIGATYEFLDGISAFAGYSEGFRGVVAGGFYSIAPKPETSQSYEAGFKLAAPIPGLTGTVAAYQVTRQNVLTPDPAIPFAFIQSGEQRARGVETDLIYEPDRALSLLLNYTYTDAAVTKDNALPVGDQLRAVPANSGRLALRYRFQDKALKGFQFGVGLTAVSRRQLTLPNTLTVGGMALVDAQASYDFGIAELSLSVVNLFDRKVFDPYQYFGGAYVSPTQPRSAYLTIRHNF